MRKAILILTFGLAVATGSSAHSPEPASWIRINQLGYRPGDVKVAVWCSKGLGSIASFQIIDAADGKPVFRAEAGESFGSYGPFMQSFRLDFTAFKRPGFYVIQVGTTISPGFEIGNDVYKGAADFCLRYMRQQRSGFNPFLRDSCHTHDGYTMYGPMPDSTHIDVKGGWHDATDYLQYSATTANATYHLLAAYRDFPTVFGDVCTANGLPGKNGQADVLDEASWGLQWLLKMHPRADWMFNQLGDDRDHHGMRLPGEDPFYGKGFERPVYFCTGQPQGLGKYKNRATGVASTAGKFSSAFALGSQIFSKNNPTFSASLRDHAISAYRLGLDRPGVCQTASCVSPYFYEEENWVDDMELASAALHQVDPRPEYIDSARGFAAREPVTPWLGRDTARHYQWYPFINIGHYELGRNGDAATRKRILDYYRRGIDSVWQRSKDNAFYHGVPFIWCSNNLTVAFAIQCYWYRTLSHDNTYSQLEQSAFDWIFGCNPWGTSFVYGLPDGGDTPADPHSSFTHLKGYPIDGGLVDGPVYGSIFSKLLGLTLQEPDEYADFQSALVVYHDDVGDYSTNEPTMDGTASLIYLLGSRSR